MVLCNEACAAAMGLKREAGGGAAGGPKGGQGPAAQLEVQELRCVAGLGVCCNNGATAERGWDGTKKGAARSRALLGCWMGWDEWWSRGSRSVLGLYETRPSTKQPSLPSWDGSWLGRISLGSVSRSTKGTGTAAMQNDKRAKDGHDNGPAGECGQGQPKIPAWCLWLDAGEE